MTRPTHPQPDTSTAPERRNPFLIVGVIALAVVVALGALFLLNRAPQGAGPSAPASPSSPASAAPSEPASPSQAPTGSPEPADTPAPTPVAAPEGWTLVHEFGPEGTRWVGAEIAYGNAGFLAFGRRWEGGEGGPRITENAAFLSADGRMWADVAFPTVEGRDVFVNVLIGAADGSYVLHAQDQAESGPVWVSLRSTDGVTWEPFDTGLTEDVYVQAITQGPSGYLLVGGQAMNADPSLWLSADGLTWERVHEFSQDTAFVQLQGADGGEDGYVVLGRRIQPDGGPYQRFSFASADGREWVEQAEPFGPDDQQFVGDVGVTSLGPDWVATLAQPDNTTTTFTSSDGLTWTEAGSMPIRNEDVALVGVLDEIGDELIASPGGGMDFAGTPGVFSSTDGASWSPVDMGADAWLAKLAIGNGVAAVTGTIPGAEFTSTGGIWIRAAE